MLNWSIVNSKNVKIKFWPILWPCPLKWIWSHFNRSLGFCYLCQTPGYFIVGYSAVALWNQEGLSGFRAKTTQSRCMHICLWFLFYILCFKSSLCHWTVSGFLPINASNYSVIVFWQSFWLPSTFILCSLFPSLLLRWMYMYLIMLKMLNVWWKYKKRDVIIIYSL